MENIIEGSYVGRRIIVRYAWDGEKDIISSQDIGGVVTKDDDKKLQKRGASPRF